MPPVLTEKADLIIRPAQYRDVDLLEQTCGVASASDCINYSIASEEWDGSPPACRGLLRVLTGLLTPWKYMFSAHQADSNMPLGMIRVSPFNRTRSTWRVDQVVVGRGDRFLAVSNSRLPLGDPAGRLGDAATVLLPAEIGSHLLRYCLETIWEARTWLLEVNVTDASALALYRQNGFQPLAQMTYWEIAPDLLRELAEREPDLPNLLPVSNADAQLLYQLDTAAMPPLVRQVFDRHILDFRSNLMEALLEGMRNWFHQREVVSGYVFEPQRKAAIGYFQMQLCRDGSRVHRSELTVHPAYTWLYPELLSQMARITQDFPPQGLQVVSSDYQPEREEYLTRMGATRISHTLMMSRSVWHKLRESKPMTLEGLQLTDVFQGLQPTRKPVPGRISLLRSLKTDLDTPIVSGSAADRTEGSRRSTPGRSTAQPMSSRLHLPPGAEFSDPTQEGPCC